MLLLLAVIMLGTAAWFVFVLFRDFAAVYRKSKKSGGNYGPAPGGRGRSTWTFTVVASVILLLAGLVHLSMNQDDEKALLEAAREGACDHVAHFGVMSDRGRDACTQHFTCDTYSIDYQSSDKANVTFFEAGRIDDRVSVERDSDDHWNTVN